MLERFQRKQANHHLGQRGQRPYFFGMLGKEHLAGVCLLQHNRSKIP
jgi:hypothetical protein